MNERPQYPFRAYQTRAYETPPLPVEAEPFPDLGERETRAHALRAAVEFMASSTLEHVLEVAREFETFLRGEGDGVNLTQEPSVNVSTTRGWQGWVDEVQGWGKAVGALCRVTGLRHSPGTWTCTACDPGPSSPPQDPVDSDALRRYTEGHGAPLVPPCAPGDPSGGVR
jgi:hypothetical protein